MQSLRERKGHPPEPEERMERQRSSGSWRWGGGQGQARARFPGFCMVSWEGSRTGEPLSRSWGVLPGRSER